jgi:hypothetical protein
MIAQLVTVDLSGLAAAYLTGVEVNSLFVLARAAITPLLMIDVRSRVTRIAWEQKPGRCRQQTLASRWPLRSPAHSRPPQ